MNEELKHQKTLFWGCFIALIATAFGFIIRAMIIGDWAKEFNLTPTQQGEIFGAGLWPFAISIILFSLIIDKIGYKAAMIFGFVCHVVSLVVTLTAKSYGQLYLGMFIVALGNGTVEAYINPVVATMFSKDKTKWLNILHAGWPGGLVLGGILTIALDTTMGTNIASSLGMSLWKVKILLLAIPVVVYIIMLIGQQFPVNERVAAGVSYQEMIKEIGAIGLFLVFWMIYSELSRVGGLSSPILMGAFLASAFALAVGVSLEAGGRPLYIFMLLIMIILATTELGVDSWVTALLTPAMGEKAKWIIVYTSFIMMVLRFCAGPIIHKLSPLGMLAVCSVLAACGLLALSGAATAGMIILAATLYGVGKTFFWPTTLGIISEQFPRGGALTLNAMGGMGMLGVGVIGAMLMGNVQDKAIDVTLNKTDVKVHEQVMVQKTSLLGRYQAIDETKLEAADDNAKKVVKNAQDESKKVALKYVAALPAIMFLCYVGLIIYFRSRGGYKAVDITDTSKA